VLCASFIVLVSFALASNRGLVWQWVRHQRNRRRLRVDAILTDLYTLASHHEDPDHGHTIEVLRTMSGGQGGVERSLRELETRGWVHQVGDEWSLTPEGLVEVERLGGDQ
jgi:manganese/zinc/iron transport system permease protein